MEKVVKFLPLLLIGAALLFVALFQRIEHKSSRGFIIEKSFNLQDK